MSLMKRGGCASGSFDPMLAVDVCVQVFVPPDFAYRDHRCRNDDEVTITPNISLPREGC